MEFPGGGGSVRPKMYEVHDCMKVNWNFQRGGSWGLRKNLFCREGMDISGITLCIKVPVNPV